jgi:Zn-dependent protease
MAVRLFPSSSLRLGRVGPIEVTVNVTWLVVFALLVYWLRTGYVHESAPEMSGYLAWLVSVVAVLVLFASVLAHELAHSLVAIRNGLMIRRITLFIFGGVAHMESEPQRPGVEFKMAVAGPLASLALAGLLGLAWVLVPDGAGQGSVVLVLEYAALANAVLACFNLIPGYPLDGGRVLRAVLWKVTGDFVRATTVAAALGRVVGLGLVFLGGMLSAAFSSLGPMWIVLVGSFLERLAFFSAYRTRLDAARRAQLQQMQQMQQAQWSSEGGFTPPQWSSDQQ